MDCNGSFLSPKLPQRAGKRWSVNFDRLTLVTLLIAVAGFAGTALAVDASWLAVTPQAVSH